MFTRYAAPAMALLGLVAGQVTTDCNPMDKDDCKPDPAFGTTYNFNFNTTPSGDLWDTTVGNVNYDSEQGAIFTINKQGDSPTIRTPFYFFFGRTEIHMKAARGRGIVSSMMWLSDVLDEVDWEFLGTNTHGSTNYFAKGRQDYHNAGWHEVKGIHEDYHNYTTTWTSDRLDWFIDGQNVRTLQAKDANSTHNFPQTPMRLSIGIWAGGDPTLPEGTREWAGGDTNYAEAPFNMYVKSCLIEDYSSGKEYIYNDRSGSWKSIEIVKGNSTAVVSINKVPEKSVGEKWSELPPAAKTAVYGGGVGVGALGVGAFAFYFWRQRRQGAAEAERAEQERMELLQVNEANEAVANKAAANTEAANMNEKLV